MRKNAGSAFFVWAWLLTLPITVIGAYWVYCVTERYFDFRVRYQDYVLARSGEMTLSALGRYELAVIAQRARVEILRPFLPKSSIKSVRIFMPESGLKKLDSNLPHSGYQSVKGRMLVDGKLIKARFRYRGDTYYRWAWHKKSLRVKTGKKNLYEGTRSFNLLAARTKEQLNNYLSYRLAAQMGLLVPRSEMVRVFVNGKDRGVHFLVDQVSEQMLRRQGYMPGDIYRGELYGKDEFVAGGVESLFETPYVWDKMAANNHYELASMGPLEALINLFRMDSQEEIQGRLSDLLDLEYWGRFSAFEALTQSTHTDETHNWRVYYDPWRQKFYPIVWDAMGWARTIKSGGIEHAQMPNTLMSYLFRNGDFLRFRANALAGVYESGLDKEFLDFVGSESQRLFKESRTDPFLRPPNMEELNDALNQLNKHIDAVFAYFRKLAGGRRDVTLDYSVSENELVLRVDGEVAIDQLVLEFDRGVDGVSSVVAEYMGLHERKSADIFGSSSAHGRSLTIDATFLPNYEIESVVDSDELVPAEKLVQREPATYIIKVAGVPPEATLVSLRGRTGSGMVRGVRVDEIKKTKFRQLHEPVKSKSFTQPIVWGGEVNVSGRMEIRSDLIIEPGATVRIEADSSLIIYGKVIAVGTAEAPIRVVPAVAGQSPWGTFALQGRGADGSRFSYCEFVGGSGSRGDLFEYSGMFSVHDVQDVDVQDSLFRDGKLVDDMVHVVYSTISMRRVKFIGAYSDALDLDMSKAHISDSYFSKSGNDAIDFMGTEAVVVGTTFLDSGDKAMSVGENSKVYAAQNKFENNVVAVQSKDRSVAIIFNSEFRNNGTTFHAYLKNWQYGAGGRIYAAKSLSDGKENSVPAIAGRQSHVVLFDSYFGRMVSENKRLLAIQIDSVERRRAKNGMSQPPSSKLPEDILTALKHMPPAVASVLDFRQRGVTQHE